MMGYRVEGLTYSYSAKSPPALSDVSLTVEGGETFGIVGGSGSGKTTLISLMCGVIPPPKGTVFFGKKDISEFDRRERSLFFRRAQIVFQDPRSSFNPMKTLGQSLHSALRAGGCAEREKRDEKIADALEAVRLSPELLNRYPDEISGGQRQRAAIARALSMEPEVLILDEPVSALDVSVQAGVMNTLKEILARRRLTALLVAHDLAVVGYMADRAAVLCNGKVVECTDTGTMFTAPRHGYTKELMDAIPSVTE